MTTPESEKCSHEGCVCMVSAATQGGKRYCSDGCASGRGCAHPECNCAAYDAPMRSEG